MNKTIIISVVIFISSYYLGVNISRLSNSNESAKIITLRKCDPVYQKCNVRIGKGEIIFSFEGEVSSLSQFRMNVLVNAIDISNISLEIRMKGMNMGSNVYSFDNNNDNFWNANIVFPVCSLNRNDWVARLIVRANNINYFVDFSFNSISIK